MNGKTLKSLGYLVALLVVALLAQRYGGDGGERAARPPAAGQPVAQDFDFYVLSLSWSPSYCEIEGAEADKAQCDAGRPYAFVVHGLWPQFEKGFPRDCASDRDGPDQALVSSMLDIMPAPGLVRHEWRAHGTCSGLSAEDYFAATRKAFARVAIPAEYRRLETWTTVKPGEVEKAFVAANPGLRPDAVAPVCGKRFLSEMRLCMTTDLAFRPCPEIDRDACRLDKAVMPPVRGG